MVNLLLRRYALKRACSQLALRLDLVVWLIATLVDAHLLVEMKTEVLESYLDQEAEVAIIYQHSRNESPESTNLRLRRWLAFCLAWGIFRLQGWL